jgi:hypothetical protein
MGHQLWNVCRKYNISPNQLYYLDSCREKIVPSQVINAEALKVVCLERGWITPEGNLTEGAIYILDEFETFLKKTKTKITKQILGDDFMKNVNEYREMFPNKRLPSKELGRQSPSELADKFVKFFKKYPQYDWELILDATDYYVNYYKKVGFKFMVTSSYFIMKNDTSKLADTCQAIIDNPKILNDI